MHQKGGDSDASSLVPPTCAMACAAELSCVRISADLGKPAHWKYQNG